MPQYENRMTWRESLRRKSAPRDFSWQPALGLANLPSMDAYVKNVLGLSGLGMLNLAGVEKSAEASIPISNSDSSSVLERSLDNVTPEILFWFVLPRVPDQDELSFLEKVAVAVGETSWGWVELDKFTQDHSRLERSEERKGGLRWVHLTGEKQLSDQWQLHSRHLDELTSGEEARKQGAKRELWNALRAWNKN